MFTMVSEAAAAAREAGCGCSCGEAGELSRGKDCEGVIMLSMPTIIIELKLLRRKLDVDAAAEKLVRMMEWWQSYSEAKLCQGVKMLSMPTTVIEAAAAAQEAGCRCSCREAGAHDGVAAEFPGGRHALRS